MTIDLTREEWQAARKRAITAIGRDAPMQSIVEAALGPCPPEPVPKDWYAGNLFLSAVKVGGRRSVVIYCDDPQREDPCPLTPDEADAMAASLMEHARYAREQGAAGG